MSDHEMPQAGLFFNPFASDEISPPHSPYWEAKRRVAGALRELVDVLVTSTAEIAELHRVAGQLEEQARRFADAPRLYGELAFVQSGEHGGHGEINHELNAIGGWSNPLSPGLNMWIDGNRAHGTVNCGWAYEGPPGYVHGGFVAAILDQFLGMAQVASKDPGMTGTLSIRYLRPTPLNTDLSLYAEVAPAGERKTLVKGEIRAGDAITATAEGLFIRPRQLPGYHPDQAGADRSDRDTQ
jgi:hypothetical protein